MAQTATQRAVKTSPPENTGYALPPSPVQERIWQLHKAGKLSSAWNISSRFRLIGPLDIDSLQQATELYVQQNEIFRTILREQDGRLRQIVLLAHKPQLDFFDLLDLAESQRTREIDAISTQHSTQLLDPTLEPPVRFALIRVRAEEWIFLVCLHQAVADGWTLGLVSDGIGCLYQRLISNRDIQALNPELAYGDYVAWHQQIVASSKYLKHLAYWRRSLTSKRTTQIPSTLQRTVETPSAPSLILSVLLPSVLTDALESLAISRDSTFHVVTMAAFEVLLSAHTASNNLLFGTPVAARTCSEFEAIPGNLSNVLPITQTLSPKATFLSLIDQQQEQFQEALEHAECRYEHLRLLSGDSQNDPVRILFQTQKDFVRNTVYGNVCLQPMPSISSGPLYDLTFFLVRRSEGWRLSCEADLCRYSQDFVETLLHQYQTVLNGIVTDPSSQIDTLRTLCASGLAKDVLEYSDPAAEIQTFPATPGQVRFHLLETLDQKTTANLLLFGFRVTGPLDMNACMFALRTLIQRHNTLQTSLFRNGDMWLQQVDPALYPQFRVLQSEDEFQANTMLVQSLTERATTFSDAPFQMCSVYVNPELAFVGFALHHTVADGWSAGQMAEEFFTFYEAARGASSPYLKISPAMAEIQFADWAVWQSLQSKFIAEEEKHAFWEQILNEPLHNLPIPFCPQHDTSAHLSRTLKTRLLDVGLAEKIRALALSQDATLYTVYLAAWLCLLHRYSGKEDIVCGTPFANRAPSTESILGPMSTPLLLRTKLAAEQSFLSLINTANTTLQAAIEHALPFEDILTKAKMVSSASRTPLFQHYFYMQRSFLKPRVCGETHFTPLETLPGSTFAEWELAVIERSEGIRLELHYRLQQYSHHAADAILDDFVSILRTVTDAPLQPIRLLKVDNFLQIAEREGVSDALTAEAAPMPATDTAPRVSNPQAVAQMVQLWRIAFKNSSITEESDFFAAGGNSLLLAELLFSIRKEFGIRFTPRDVLTAPTPRQLAASFMPSATVDESARAKTLPGIVPVQPHGSKPPIFVISQSLIFKEIADALGHDRPLLALTMSDDDAAKLGTMCSLEDIAKYYVRLLRSVQPHGPYVIGGWCVAAVVAYEVARQLQDAEEPVALLMIIDSWAPGHWHRIGALRASLAHWSYRLQRSITHLSSILHARGQKRAEEISNRWTYICTGTRREICRRLANLDFLQTSPEDKPLPLREQIEYNAAKRYISQPYSGRTLLFKNKEQPEGWFIDPKLGWDALLGKDCVLQVIPGDHARMFQGEGAQIISEALRRSLADIERNASVAPSESVQP